MAAVPDTAASPLPRLFQPYTLRGLTLRNRVVVSPMCQYVSQDGAATDWHLVHLGKFAMGGAALVFCEETAVEERGRKTYGCAGMYDHRHVTAARRVNDFIHAAGAAAGIQLGHAGRKASCGPPWTNFRPLTEEDAQQGMPPWRGVSSSELPAKPGALVPQALDESQIRAMVQTWRTAAQRSVDAGYDVCEVHGAHGYLIHQFLSPLANLRTDGWGGDLAGRMRLALEISEAVRQVWPKERPVFFRVSAVDGDGGAWDMDDTVVLSRALRERGIDLVTCSSGGINGPLNMAVVPRVPGYQVPYAERVRNEAGIASCAVGLITEPAHAERILRQGQADLIALARELMADPNWPVRAAQALGVPDYLGLLPQDYAWWLRRREDIRALGSGA
ncbi:MULTISPECIES: NADH:flavin oxidoreductase/NADH oxidase [unclassified Achromobacter]|uniref:NADH:flavin oxidoreductase/NADH oxidase n=1 Tax=unclassified Achromobacter TaxID=2626865 RepID=UPI000B51851F|nr:MULTISPECIES: NADH:flavin oxidoreductase/NADH oxidase [unclassified Achromobacter]OWT80422.1 NADH:flavin oxidoreductase / NADH oxidase [Achromobacter sp. HZ34]OWT82305.1 NADH:flavin oxidoreductase / NADH oxidase [Achromobacter sp. HZ28]